MKISYFFPLALFFLIIACKGPKGDPGTDGPMGIQGIQGTPGNANVYTYNYTILSWGYDGNHYYSEVDGADGFELSAADLSSAATMAYIKTGSLYVALPTVSFPSGGTQYYRPYFGVNLFRIWVDTEGGDVAPEFEAPRDVKVVIIPQSQRLAEPDVDLLNYEDVKRTFNLED